MRENLIIDEIEEKPKGDGNTMWRIKSNDTWYSTFSKTVASKLMDKKGKKCEVEVVSNGKYFNITNFYSASDPPAPPVQIIQNKSVGTSDERRLEGFATAYAKDWVVAQLQAMAPKAKDLGEVQIIILDLDDKFQVYAKKFYNIMKGGL